MNFASPNKRGEGAAKLSRRHGPSQCHNHLATASAIIRSTENKESELQNTMKHYRQKDRRQKIKMKRKNTSCRNEGGEKIWLAGGAISAGFSAIPVAKITPPLCCIHDHGAIEVAVMLLQKPGDRALAILCCPSRQGTHCGNPL